MVFLNSQEDTLNILGGNKFTSVENHLRYCKKSKQLVLFSKHLRIRR